ncbi:MAG TPA: fasciclin domain-containing protein [Chitinophagaceae bacterium]|nr:fasciclin domain-containing protein [Chitinophagaceae bacterium]
MATILDIANSQKSLSILMKSIKVAGLEEELNGLGPFTIFAPVNLAFSRMDPGVFEEMIKPANKQRLTEILNYHIVLGKSLSGDLSNGQKLKTINGQELLVTLQNNEVYINNGKMLSCNMRGTNGVLHTVDAVNIAQ